MRRGKSGQECPRRGDSSQVDSKDISFYELSAHILMSIYCSWSKQIIEHERAEAAKEAAAKGQQ